MFSRVKMRICAMTTAILLAMLTFVPALAESGSSTLASTGDKYTVTASKLNVRMGAGTSFSVLCRVYKGKTVTYLDKENGWWYVRLSDGTTGYVDKKYLTPQAATDVGVYTVTASTLRMRSRPSTSGSRVGKLSRGTNVKVTKLNGDWGYVTYGGKSGWVALKYLKEGGTATAASFVSVGSTYTVIADTLNVRHRATTSSSRIGAIKRGETVRVSKLSGDWAYVSYEYRGTLKSGWVSTKYIG